MNFFVRRGKSLKAVAVLAVVFLAGIFIERAPRCFSDPGCSAAGIFPQAFAKEQLLGELPDVVEKAMPAVVNISSKKVISMRESPMSSIFSDPFFRRFFGDEFSKRYKMPRERIERSLGSGVIVTKDGYILTNNHLVDKAEEIEVFLTDNREYDAKIVGADPKTDVAVLKIDEEDLPALTLGNSSELRLGQIVLAIGYPYGIGQTVTMGIISALKRANLRMVDYEDFIQTDAAINPGNSGGALIDVHGRLIGINTAILSRSGGSQGIGFAIPIDLAYSVMESIINHGRVIRGWLGVVIQDMTPQMAESFDMDDARGVIISDVQDGSPAMKGGIERGDVIVAYRGKDVDNMQEFRKMVAMTEPGEKVKIEVLKDGKSKELKVRIGEHPSTAEKGKEEETEEEGSSPLFLGVGLENLSDYYRHELNLPADLRGVVVTEVERDVPAAEAGLKAGDVIIEVNRRDTSSLKKFNKVIEKSGRDKVLLLVYRDGNHFYILVRD